MIPTLTKIAIALSLASTPLTPHTLLPHSASISSTHGAFYTSPRPRVAGDTVADSILSAVDTTTIPLTAELLSRFGRLSNELYDYKNMNRSMDSVMQHHSLLALVVYAGPGVPRIVKDYRCDQFIYYAAQWTDLANIFKKYHIPPRMYWPLRFSVERAEFAIDASTYTGQPLIADTASIVGRNIALVKAHRQEVRLFRINHNHMNFSLPCDTLKTRDNIYKDFQCKNH